MEAIIEMLKEVNIYSTILRLLMATAVGGIIGLERGSKKRAAGFRTYMLVCVGAALVMITNQYIVDYFEGSDPARLGAQVISGIGFLGAGTIIVTRNNQVIGLTTAAGLWASACLGLAIGIGFYAGAIVASILISMIITVLHRIDRKVVSQSQSLEVYIEISENAKLSDIINYARAQDIQVFHVEFERSRGEAHRQTAVILSLYLPKRQPHYEVIEEFSQQDCVDFIEEL